MRFFILFWTVFSIHSLAFAKVRIAFLENYDHLGRQIQYEPGGRFVHTAIQFDDIGEYWLNAYPGEGVAVISWQRLQQHGTVTEILELPMDLSYAEIQPYLGRPFDFWYSWTEEAIYCSELIGKLLGVPTHPMRFNKNVWPKNYWKLEGTPGLSPDELWRWAQAYQNERSMSSGLDISVDDKTE